MEHVQHGYAYPNDDIMKSDAGIFSTSWRFCDHDTALEIGINESLTVLTHVAENYLLALCESDRTKEILQLLERMDVTKISSLPFVDSIFRCLGRQLLNSFAEKFLLEFKACGMFMIF